MPDRSFLAWPFFDDRHRALAAKLDAWTAAEIEPLAHGERDVDALSRRFVGMLGDAGWLRYAVPREYGGHFAKLDVRSLCLVREALARISGLADFAFAMQGLGSASIALYGSEALKRHYLPRVCAGRQIAAFALSEPEGGSDVSALRVTAQRDGEEYVLDGSKTWISNADIATEIDAAALLIYRAAWTKDCMAERVTREAAMAKMYATEAAQRVIDAAVQLHGGVGVVSGVPVERLYREIRALRIYEGTTEIQKLVIASQVLAEASR